MITIGGKEITCLLYTSCDKDANALKETGLVIKPEGSGLYAQDNTGKIALIDVG